MVEALHTQNLQELGLEYVDHVMIHYPSDWDHTVTGPTQRQDEWRALEGIYATLQARTIGISHYCPHHIWDIVAIATILPALNQVEYHIGSQDIDTVIETCTKLGITFMSFSPLCGTYIYIYIYIHIYTYVCNVFRLYSMLYSISFLCVVFICIFQDLCLKTISIEYNQT